MTLQNKLQEKGGVDAYIATTICLMILVLCFSAAFILFNTMNKYTTLQRALDMAIDDIKTYGGYTETTHETIRSFLRSRGIDTDDVSVQLDRAPGEPILYGEAPVVVHFEYIMRFRFLSGADNLGMGNWTLTLKADSTATSQYVPGAVPDDCYCNTTSKVSLSSNLPCSVYTPSSTSTDIWWE